MTKKKYDRKPRFQRLYAGLLGKALAAALAVAALQLTVCASELPEGVSADATLTASDTDSYNSLDTNAKYHHWSDNNPITEGDTEKVYYVPSGKTARTSSIEKNYKIIPVIYSSGCIYPRVKSSKTVTFNDLRLLDGGSLDCRQINVMAGNITILANDPDNPASLYYNRQDVRAYSLKATLIGEEYSQLLYNVAYSQHKGYLSLREGSNWNGFKGTLRVADGLSVCSYDNAPITSPCTVKFGNDGNLRMTAVDAPYSLGNLSFVENGMIENTGDGAALTVTGTFDTGKNCTWFSRNAGTFGTLKLGDGLTLVDNQVAPKTTLTVTKKLELGTDVTIKCPNALFCDGTALNKVLIFKLSPEAVNAGLPDFSEIEVILASTAFPAGLEVVDDPDQVGGRLVYATYASSDFAYYTGPTEWSNDDADVEHGDWLNPEKAPDLWSDNACPDGDKIYCITRDLTFPEGNNTFSGKMLVCRNDLYMLGSAQVPNLILEGGGRIYSRNTNLHLGGNLTAMDGSTIRHLSSRSLYLDSILHGIGGLTFNSYYPDGNGSSFYLTADNSDWIGQLRTSWTDRNDGLCPASEEHHTRIVVGDAKSLGGNPAEYTYDSMLLGDYAEIRFTRTTVQTASNRGLYVTNGIIRVDFSATADLNAPVTVEGTLRKYGEGTLGFGGGIRYNATGSLKVKPTEGKNILLVKEGAIKGSSMTGIKVTFSDGAGIAADGSGASDLSGAEIVAEGTIYLKADGNTLPEPTQNVTYPIVKVSAAQAAELGDKFKAARSPWRGWPVTLLSETDADGNVTYSVKYEKKGFVMSIR